MPLTSFNLDGHSLPVQFVETMPVKEGVECDVYAFVGDDSKDLAIVRVQSGFRTPLQRVLLGKQTIEGLVSGQGTLTVQIADERRVYEFGPGLDTPPVAVEVGQLMQWQASPLEVLTFYEICEPPYADGRFEDLPDNDERAATRNEL